MKIKIKRFDKSLPLPEYKTEGAAGFDLYAREDTTIESNEIGYIPLNVALEIPENTWVLLAARGSTHKYGLIPANGIGVGDSDFKGDKDEYNFIAYNFKKEPVTIEKGTRIAQMILVNYRQVEFEEVESLENEDRGWLGSTGVD